ncbi:MAG: hypothetical protein JXB07_18850 [Anaerolineae bacterium]|nr:hypothetical protein [Anaerolineae bacterium]
MGYRTFGTLAKKYKLLGQIGVAGGGGYVEDIDFTVAASDSFDRDNGALGNTDGAGIDGVLGGFWWNKMEADAARL